VIVIVPKKLKYYDCWAVLADAGRGVITDNGVVLVGGGEEMICIEPILAH